VNSTSIRFYSR